MRDLSPEGEVLAAHIAATMTAMKVLVLTLEANGALEPGRYQAALLEVMEKSKDDLTPSTLALLSDLRGTARLTLAPVPTRRPPNAKHPAFAGRAQNAISNFHEYEEFRK
jgi:hypothetical protein